MAARRGAKKPLCPLAPDSPSARFSFYERIKANRQAGVHTLCLLDIKVKEISDANLARGRKIYEPPRFMTINQCIDQLLLVEEKRKEQVYAREEKRATGGRLGGGRRVSGRTVCFSFY